MADKISYTVMLGDTPASVAAQFCITTEDVETAAVKASGAASRSTGPKLKPGTELDLTEAVTRTFC